MTGKPSSESVEALALSQPGLAPVEGASLPEEPYRAIERALGMVIGKRVREYRVQLGLSVAELARRMDLSKGMLSKIENAQVSPSLSTLARLAAVVSVPVTSFFRGFDDEREAVFVKAGHGATIVRRGSRVGHEYVLLGSMRGNFKRMEPLLVTLDERSEVFPLFQHSGTELIYMLEGRMSYGYGNTTYAMEASDVLQFDGEVPHGPVELTQVPIRFLSITAHGHVNEEQV